MFGVLRGAAHPSLLYIFGSWYTVLNLPVLFGDYAAYGAIVCSCDAVRLFYLELYVKFTV
jgi:hypothetical protein